MNWWQNSVLRVISTLTPSGDIFTNYSKKFISSMRLSLGDKVLLCVKSKTKQ